MKLFLLLLCVHLAFSFKYNARENDDIQATCGLTLDQKKLQDGNRLIASKQAPTLVWVIIEEGKTTNFCMGTRISTRHVITAAQCFRSIVQSTNCSEKVKVDISAIRVVDQILCTKNSCLHYKDKKAQHRVQEISDVSPFICNNSKADNFAILTVDKNMYRSSKSTYACLVENQLELGTKVRFYKYAGYGAFSEKSKKGALKEYETEVVECSEKERNPGLICFKNFAPQSTCDSNSGGGYVLNSSDDRITLAAIHTSDDRPCLKNLQKPGTKRAVSSIVNAINIYHLLDFICKETGICVR